MRLLAVIAILFCATAAARVRVNPTTAPAGGGAVIRIDGRPTRIVATCDWSDLIQIRSTAGRLVVETSLPDRLAGVLGLQPQFVRVRESPDPWRISIERAVGRRGAPGGWNLTAAAGRLDGPDLPDFRPRQVVTFPGHFHVIGEGSVGGHIVRAEFYLIGPQLNPEAQLTIADPIDSDKPPEIIRTATFSEMLSKHPDKVRRYVSPMLDAIAGRRVIKPAAVDIYRAFDSIQPDEKIAAQVQLLVNDLGAPDANRRKAASEKLDQIGAPAVLAVLRMDRSALSPEQQSRVTKFLADNTTGIDPQAALHDSVFLIQALCDDDRRVRSAAKDALAKLWGRTMEFDIDQSADARAAAADRLIESSQPGASKP